MPLMTPDEGSRLKPFGKAEFTDQVWDDTPLVATNCMWAMTDSRADCDAEGLLIELWNLIGDSESELKRAGAGRRPGNIAS